MASEIYLTDTAIADLEQFEPDTARRLALIESLEEHLGFMPGRFRRCPEASRFGPEAYFYTEGRFTIVFDLVGAGEVWIRHLWPSASLRAAQLHEPQP